MGETEGRGRGARMSGKKGGRIWRERKEGGENREQRKEKKKEKEEIGGKRVIISVILPTGLRWRPLKS